MQKPKKKYFQSHETNQIMIFKQIRFQRKYLVKNVTSCEKKPYFHLKYNYKKKERKHVLETNAGHLSPL